MHQEVTVVIPGAINSYQVKQNTDVSEKRDYLRPYARN